MLLNIFQKKAKEQYVVSIVPVTNAYAKPRTLNLSTIRRGIIAAAILGLIFIAVIIVGLVYIRVLRLRMSDQYSSTLGLGEYISQLEAHVVEQVREIEALTQRLNQLSSAPSRTPAPKEQSLRVLPSPTPEARHATLLDWFDGGSKAYPRGKEALPTDVETGLSFHIRRIGGQFHGDSEPLTAEDTAVFLKICGGKWSWARRAAWITIDNVTYACSVNGMPHSDNPNKNNNFDGHFCLHFYKSKVHETGKECPIHQAMVQKAFGAELPDALK